MDVQPDVQWLLEVSALNLRTANARDRKEVLDPSFRERHQTIAITNFRRYLEIQPEDPYVRVGPIRFIGLWTVFFSAVAPLHGQSADKAQKNVVLIVADYMGYRDTEPYGATDIRTPNLKSLADEGIRFTNAYATAPVCPPSRAPLRVPPFYRDGISIEGGTSERRGLPQSELTIAKALKTQGYATAMVGKWHLGFGDESRPNAHGFDESLAFNSWSIDYYSHRTPTGEPGLFHNGKPVDVDGYSTDIFTERAMSFIGEHLDQPFFVYLAYNATLPPLQAPNRPDDIRISEPGAFPKKSWYRSTRADYIKVVESMDSGIGRILKQLDEAGISDETLVIFTCDHGAVNELAIITWIRYSLGRRDPHSLHYPLAGSIRCRDGFIATDDLDGFIADDSCRNRNFNSNRTSSRRPRPYATPDRK